MSEKRYYYTDMVAALWMSKHFGMEFESPVMANDIPSIALLQLFIMGRDRPVLIKASSLHLLEPQKGDVVEVDITTTSNKDEVLCHQYGALYANGQIDTRFTASKSDVRKIIQRNGKAFHWPEEAI